MTNWKEYKLGELIETVSKTFKFSDKKVVFLNTSDTLEGKVINHNLFEPKKLPGQAKKTIQPNDILYSEIRPANKRYAFVDFDSSNYVVSTKLMVLRVLDEEIISPKYLYYFLTSDEIVSYLQMLAESRSGTFPQIRFEEVSLLDIKLPPINVQNEIVELVASLDDKIELNNKINQELENLAQTLFKQWFIDFEFPNEKGEPYKSSGGEMVDSELGEIPKGWKVVSLKELLNNVKKTTKAGVHLSDRKYVPIDELPMKSLTANSFREYSEAVSSLLLFEKFDILIGAMRVYFHRVCIAPFKGVTRSTCFVLRPKNPIDLAFALLLLNRDETISFASATSKGSTMPYAVWENGLADFTVAYPNSVLSNEFNELLFPIFKNLINNSKENIELTNLRNTLLPKLISGELEVSDIQTNTL